MVSEGQPWVFTGEHLSQVEQVAPRVANIQRFDVPQLERLIGTAFPAELDAWVLDTLELASLVFPDVPSQALDKLYREQSSLSDPVQDCLESAQVLARCVRALPGLVRSVARRLPPPGATCDLILAEVT